MSTVIEDVVLRKVFNSLGNPTIEVEVLTEDGFGRVAAPSGSSRGRSEVVQYPEGGVEEAIVRAEEEVVPELIGMDADRQESIDKLLHEIDGTEDFHVIGGNTAFAISIAVAEAAADSYGIPLFQYLGGILATELPHPLGNVLGGGAHTHGKGTDIQEMLVIPVRADSFREAVEANFAVHRRIRSLLEERDPAFSGGKGAEGAWTTNLSDTEALEVVKEAVDQVTDEMNVECKMGLDIAAGTLWQPDKERYFYRKSGVSRTREEQMDFVMKMIEDYDVYYVEDPFHEEDYESFRELTAAFKDRLICGDDLFVTNSERLKKGIAMEAANSIIIKVNQIGTLTDAWVTVKTAKRAGYVPIVSHRSGETPYSHIAHLALAFGTPIIKTGVVGGERVIKLNELVRIEELLGEEAKLAEI